MSVKRFYNVMGLGYGMGYLDARPKHLGDTEPYCIDVTMIMDFEGTLGTNFIECVVEFEKIFR